MELPNFVLLAVVRPAIVGVPAAVLAKGTGVLPVEGRSPPVSHRSKKYVELEHAPLSRFAATDNSTHHAKQLRHCRARAEPGAPGD